MISLLAIDQGTTSTRAFVVQADGCRSLIYSRRHQQFHPQSGWVEHDGEEILADILTCLDRAPHSVVAVGLGNQGESCLAWDSQTGKPVGRIIVWQDDRTRDRLTPWVGTEKEHLSLNRAGLPLDPYFSASKLGWIVQNSSTAQNLHRQGRLRLGTTDAWFLDRLCGTFVTDVTTAARTGLMNLAREQWDHDLCALHGVPLDCLPAIVDSTGPFGEVVCGGRRVPLLASVVDQQAALYGHGCQNPGDAKITFGTGAFALAVTGTLPPQQEPCSLQGPLPAIAWRKKGQPCTYALDGGVYCASAAIDWARTLGLFRDYQEIAHFSSPSAVSRGLIFVPALAGLACPHWDREARGVWSGLSLDHGRLDLVQAILEGIALRMAEVLDAMAVHVDLSAEISIDGGLTGSPYFCQFLSSVINRPVRVSTDPELTSLGLAMLAADAMGEPFSPGHTHARYEPQAHNRDARLDFARTVAFARRGDR